MTRCVACGGELTPCFSTFPVHVEERVFFERLAAHECETCSLRFSDADALERVEARLEELAPTLCTWRQKIEGLKVVEADVTTMDERLLVRECMAPAAHAGDHVCGPWFDPADPTRAIALNRGRLASAVRSWR